MSKLYTEEQVKRAYFKGASDCHDKCINRNWRGVELAVDVKHLEELNDELYNMLFAFCKPILNRKVLLESFSKGERFVEEKESSCV